MNGDHRLEPWLVTLIWTGLVVWTAGSWHAQLVWCAWVLFLSWVKPRGLREPEEQPPLLTP